MKHIVSKINTPEKLEILNSFLKEIDPLESALIKWKFVRSALKSKTWEVDIEDRIAYISEASGRVKGYLSFDVSGDNCKLCSLYLENRCRECPLIPFSGINCSNIWQTWSHNQKPMLKAIKSALKEDKKKPKKVYRRNLKLLNEKLTLK